ncbi:uncharacterized protein UTRI_00891_B [Ustilago trichophora]|uniref:Uncharacterized protein n=1 Tax=Ustilago trichophora TaxID=86804 RepID=A0A5C3DQ58_9BASI|nr:uncharacterized protein UTRI_00891_B [Ustilago trichophora]
MLISKLSFNLMAVLAVGSSIPYISAESTVTSETIPNAPKVKPEHPLFACASKSRTCRQSNNYDDLAYDGNLQLFDCSDEKLPIQIWRRIINRFFRNAFYVSCQKDDKTCEAYVRDNKLDKISDRSETRAAAMLTLSATR